MDRAGLRGTSAGRYRFGVNTSLTVITLKESLRRGRRVFLQAARTTSLGGIGGGIPFTRMRPRGELHSHVRWEGEQVRQGNHYSPQVRAGAHSRLIIDGGRFSDRETKRSITSRFESSHVCDLRIGFSVLFAEVAAKNRKVPLLAIQ
jgi:hypothetical protein